LRKKTSHKDDFKKKKQFVFLGEGGGVCVSLEEPSGVDKLVGYFKKQNTHTHVRFAFGNALCPGHSVS
jgi:hypothetical protein